MFRRLHRPRQFSLLYYAAKVRDSVRSRQSTGRSQLCASVGEPGLGSRSKLGVASRESRHVPRHMRLRARSRVRAPSYPLARRPFGNFPRVQVREFTFNDAISCLGAGSYFSSQVFPQMNSQLGFSSLHEHSSAVTALRTAFGYEQATDWHSRLRSWRPKRRYLQWEMESALNR